MKKMIAMLCAAVALGGCATTQNYTPMERHLNRYAGAEVIAMNCPAFGGYGSISTMRSDAEKNLSQARALGAKESDVQLARQRVNGQMQTAIFMVGPMQACSSMINSLAWAGTAPATASAVTAPAPKKAP